MRNSLVSKFFWLSLALAAFVVLTVLLVGHSRRQGRLNTLLKTIDLWMVDEDGSLLLSTSSKLPPGLWATLPHPVEPLRVSFREPLTFVVRLDTEGKKFVVGRVPGVFAKDMMFAIIMNNVPVFVAAWLIFAGVVFFFFRRKQSLVKRVIFRLKSGDLKARFPTTGGDELGMLMAEFNSMADEIESLVRKLEDANTSRAQLLEGLSHDIQTPLTSLTFLVESVAEGKLSEEATRAKMELACKELDYFRKLIESLFLLEQLPDKDDLKSKSPQNVSAIASDEFQQVVQLAKESGSSLRFKSEIHPNLLSRGDDALFHRLIRNGLENAVRYAKGEVVLDVFSHSSTELQIALRDDGEGFTDVGLETFGKRLRQRKLLEADGEKRISLGLGSVVMKAIAESSGGTLTAGNWRRADSSVGGAEIKICLPVAPTLPT